MKSKVLIKIMIIAIFCMLAINAAQATESEEQAAQTTEVATLDPLTILAQAKLPESELAKIEEPVQVAKVDEPIQVAQKKETILISKAAAPAPAEKPMKLWDAPLVGFVFGFIEMIVSPPLNVVQCGNIFSCINVGDHVGTGIGNGLERMVGTTIKWGSYERPFAQKGLLAKNKIFTNVTGMAAIFLGYGAASGVGNTLFGQAAHLRNVAWSVTGAMVGAGLSGVDIALDGGRINDKE